MKAQRAEFKMAKRKYNWMWRRLADQGAAQRKRQARPVKLRGDPTLRTVRDHAPHPTTPALERFIAMTERVLAGDDTCIVWKGGDKFRVDDFTLASPARFYWEMMLGERLAENEVLYRAYKTPRCVKHRVKRRNMT
jgi:hypothetical protein